MKKNNIIHSRLLELLVEFNKKCLRYDCKYYIMGGTLIGAVRHNGFIPWDDDVDVALPREDYEKIKKILITEKNIRFISNNNDYMYPFMRLTSTMFINKKKTEIWMDIFPLDSVRFHRVKIIQSFIIKKILLKLLWYKRYKSKSTNKIKIFLFYIIVFSTLLLISRKSLEILINFVMKFQNWIPSKNYSSFASPYSINVETFLKKHFAPGSKLSFEGICVNAPSNYHLILTQIYGDYLKLPQQKNRRNHGLLH